MAQMEKIHYLKPIIIRVGAKDETKTAPTWEKYETLLKNRKQSHANIHVNDILPPPNQSKYKMSKMINLKNRLATFCDAQQI